MEPESIATGEHRYINISKPFQWGERRVCWATEVLSKDIDAPTITTRRVILDAETGREITGPLDLQSHVVYPEPGGPYRVHQVVDAEKQKSIEPPEK